MSKSPNWADKAKSNTIGKLLDETKNTGSKVAKAPSKAGRKKVGRKKSKVQRHQALLKFSEYQNYKLNNLELRLKLGGVKISRGRSETVELALALVDTMLKTDEVKTLNILKDFVGFDESNLNSET